MGIIAWILSILGGIYLIVAILVFGFPGVWYNILEKTGLLPHWHTAMGLTRKYGRI